MPFIENASSVKLSAKSELTWFLFEDPQSAAVFRARHHEAVRWRFTLFTIHFILQWELVEISVIYCLKSKSYFYRSELLPNAFSKCNSRGGGGVLPYISPGMCCPIGSGFRAILVWKRVYTLTILVWNRLWFFGGTKRVYERYLSFQFQMNNKEREICEFEMDLKNFLVCTLI